MNRANRRLVGASVLVLALALAAAVVPYRDWVADLARVAVLAETRTRANSDVVVLGSAAPWNALFLDRYDVLVSAKGRSGASHSVSVRVHGVCLFGCSTTIDRTSLEGLASDLGGRTD